MVSRKRLSAILRPIRRKTALRWHRDGATDQGVSFPVEDLDTNTGVEVGKGVYPAKTRGADADR